MPVPLVNDVGTFSCMLSPGTYPPSAYDEHFCLRPTPLSWLAVLYFSRAFTLPLAMVLRHFSGVESNVTLWLRSLGSADGLPASAIAGVVFNAMFRRASTASSDLRWIWTHGRWLLSTGHGPAVERAHQFERDRRSGADGWTGGLVDRHLANVLMAPRITYLFAQFPSAERPIE